MVVLEIDTVLLHVQLHGEVRRMSREDLEAAIRDGSVGPETPLDTGAGWRPAREWAEWDAAAQSPQARIRARWDDPPIPWATALIAGLCIRTFLWVPVASDSRTIVDAMVRDGAHIVEGGEVWRLLTYGLLHSGLDHIATNLGLILYVGLTLERLLRGRDVLVLLAASVMAGGLATTWWNPAVSSVGISAGDFGFLGATGVLGLRWAEVMPRRSRARVGFVMVAYAAWALLNAVTAEGVDNMAHFGGLCAGAALGALYRPLDDRRNNWVSGLALGAMGLVAAVILAAGPRLQPWVALEDDGARSERPAWWEVGWTSTGELGWTSPTKAATMAVVADRHADPRTSLQLLTAWTDEVKTLDPEALVNMDNDTATARYAASSGRREARAHVVVHGRHSVMVLIEGPEADRRIGWMMRAQQSLSVTPPEAITAALAGAESPAWRLRMGAAEAAGDWGEYDRARMIADSAVALAPDDPAAALAMVELARRDGWPDAAARALAARTRFPESRTLLAAYARTLATDGRTDEARALLDEALRAAPGDTMLTRTRAELGP